MKNIKAIIFDLGAVILNINYQNTIDEFGKIGIQNASSYYSKKAQNSLFNQIETGEISDKEFLLKLQKETPNVNIKKVEDAWNAMLLDLPENRINLLKKLKNNYFIFLLSNTNSIHITEFRKRLGNNQYNKFYNLFDKVYYSHKIGFRKPQPEAFQIILDENKLLANEVFFIDDSYQHIKGAEKLGIKIHHLQENEEITTLFPDIAL
jgi:glucose-1-phosphatase